MVSENFLSAVLVLGCSGIKELVDPPAFELVPRPVAQRSIGIITGVIQKP